MIQTGSFLKVADNSGAKQVLCIKVLKGAKTAHIGNVIVVSIKEALPKGKVKAGTVSKAVVVRVKNWVKRKDGSRVNFSDNAVVLINTAGEMVGTRVLGPVGRELKNTGYMRVISLSDEVI